MQCHVAAPSICLNINSDALVTSVCDGENGNTKTFLNGSNTPPNPTIVTKVENSPAKNACFGGFNWSLFRPADRTGVQHYMSIPVSLLSEHVKYA